MQEKNALIEQFSSRFSEAIGKLSLKQKDLALAISITPQTLSRYKSGDRIPDVAELYRLSKFLGVSMNWLLGDNEPDSDAGWKQRALVSERKLSRMQDVLPLLGEVNAKLTKIAAE